MKYIYLGLNWFFSIVFFIAAIGESSILAGLCLVGMSVLCFPPLKKFIYSKTNKEIPVQAKAVSIGVLFIFFIFFDSQNRERKEQDLAAKQAQEQVEKLAKIKQEKIDYFRSNRDAIVTPIKSSFAAEDYQSVISQSTKYLAIGDIELNQLHSTAKLKLDEIHRAEQADKILAEIKITPSNNYIKSKNLYQQLANLNPENKSYKEKIIFFSDKIEGEKNKIIAEEAKKKQIETQFSAWDGSHRGLERVIKESMNDPDSYDHVETVYWDRGDYLVVRTTFRGKNAFGGIVKNSVKAKVSLSGEVLQILDQ